MGFKEVISTKALELSPYDNVDHGRAGENSFLKNQDEQQQPVSPNPQGSSPQQQPVSPNPQGSSPQQQPVSPNPQGSSPQQQPPNSPKQQQSTESSPRQLQPWPSLFQNQKAKFSSHSSPQVSPKYQQKMLPDQYNQHHTQSNQHSVKANQYEPQLSSNHLQKGYPKGQQKSHSTNAQSCANLQPMPNSHNQSESPKYITDQHISEVHVTMKSQRENTQDFHAPDHMRHLDNRNKGNSLTTTNQSLSLQSQQKFSGLNPTAEKVTSEERKPSASPANSKNQRDHVKIQEMSKEEKRRMKGRLLQEFPDQDPLVLELTLLSNNYDEPATRVMLKKWEENTVNKEEQGTCADPLERTERYKSFKTFPPAVGSSYRQSHNALGVDQDGTRYTNNDQTLRSGKISMKTLLVTSQVGSSRGGWMSQLPGVTCCLRSFKSSTYRGLTTKVITHDTIHHSFHHTEPHGPNPMLQKGPNKSLLRQECMKAAGPNAENRHGPNPHNRGVRILAMGPNYDLVRGPVRGGSPSPTVVNSL